MIKQLSINGQTFNTDNLAKLNSANQFEYPITIKSANETASYGDWGTALRLWDENMNLQESPLVEHELQQWFCEKDKHGVGVIQLRTQDQFLRFQMLLTKFQDRVQQNTWRGFTIQQDLEKNTIVCLLSENPDISSNNTQVATTEWVRRLLASKGIN